MTRMTIGLAGNSKVKLAAVTRAIVMVDQILNHELQERKSTSWYELPTYMWRLLPDVASAVVICKEVPSYVPEQPYGDDETMLGAERRAEAVKDVDMAIGIESGVKGRKGEGGRMEPPFMDVGFVVVRYKGKNYHGTSEGIEFPEEYVREAMSIGTGNEVTVGKIIAKHLGGDHANPHMTLTHGVIDRADLLARAILNAILQIKPDVPEST